jgi:hypothetical protein
MLRHIKNPELVTGKKHTIQNIGKTSSVINYTNWGSGLLVRNKPIKSGEIVTISYVTGSYHSATTTQLKTISITDLPEKSKVTSTPKIVEILPTQTHQQKTQSIVDNNIEKSMIISENHKETKQLSIKPYSGIISEIPTKNQKKNNRVIYTAIIGDYDNLKEPLVYDDTWDYVCFTNSDKVPTNTKWKIKPVPDIIQNLESVKKARSLKILPHIFLDSYHESIWVDGTIEVVSSPTDLLHEYLDGDYDIMICKHPDRICVYEEGITCKKLKKDTPVIIDKQIDQYKSEGYPEKWGMVQTGVIYRKNTENVRKHGDLWWSQVLSFSKRDQLSFNYSLWKKNLKVQILPPSIISSKFFSFYEHQNKAFKKIKLRSSYDQIQNYINGNPI